MRKLPYRNDCRGHNQGENPESDFDPFAAFGTHVCQVYRGGNEEQEAGRAHSGKLTRPTIRLYSLARRAGRVDAYRASVHRHNEKLITS